MTVRRLKGSLGGEYELNPYEVESLQAWIALRGPTDGALFPSSRSSEGLSRWGVQRIWTRICKGVSDRATKDMRPDLAIGREFWKNPHCLKHSCAILYLASGVDVLTLQSIMGHANIENTLIYAKRLNADRDRATASAFADFEAKAKKLLHDNDAPVKVKKKPKG